MMRWPTRVSWLVGVAFILGYVPSWAQTYPPPQPLGANACIAQNEWIALDPTLVGLDDLRNVALGAYERVSPDGRYVLRSFSGKNLSTVTLIELPAPGTGQRHRVIQTPLTNEAFPVQGSWRYLVEIDGSHYRLADIVNHQKAANHLFKGGMTGFYAAASELPLNNSTSILTAYAKHGETVAIRSLSWPNATAHGDAQGQGTLQSKTITVNTATQQVIADAGVQLLCSQRINQDGAMYALPMISVDGQEFSALPLKPTNGPSAMHVFGFGASGTDCEFRFRYPEASGKATFGFPPSAQPGTSGLGADLVHEYKGQVWWLPRALGQTPLNLAPWEDEGKGPVRDIIASAFPGMTRDGRVIYAATWKRCTDVATSTCINQGGYVVSDPYQSNALHNVLLALRQTGQPVPLLKTCITAGEVQKARAEFAAFHGLPP